MRRIITTLILTLIFNTSYTQDCDDPICKQIALILQQMEELKVEQKNTQLKADDYFSKWKIAEKKSKGSLEKALEYERLYNAQREIVYQSFLQLTKKNNELIEVSNKARLEENKSKSLQKMLDDASGKIEEFNKRLKKESVEKALFESDADNLAKMQSYFSVFKPCYNDGEQIKCVEVIDGGNSLFINTNLFGNKLNHIIYQGNYIEKPSEKLEVGKSEIIGRTLIYVDNELYTSIEDTLRVRSDVILNKYNYYEIGSPQQAKKLTKSLPENRIIKVGFVEEKYYSKLGLKKYHSFWGAESENLFLITTLKYLPLFDKNSVNNKELTFPEIEGGFDFFGKVSVQNDMVKISVKDNEEIDGDEIAIYLNRELIKPFTLTKDFQSTWVKLDKYENTLSIVATNEGKIKTCTAEILIEGRQQPLIIKSNKGISSGYLILQKND